MNGSTTWAAEILDGRAVKVPADRLAQRLDQSEGFVWVHVDTPDKNQWEAWLHDALGVCPLTYHDLVYEHQRSGIEQHAGTMAFIISAISGNPDRPFAPVACFLRADRVLTVSLAPIPAVIELQKLWLDDTDDIGTTAAEITFALLDAVLDDYFPALDQLHDRAEALEETIYEAERVDPKGPLTLKREMLIMRKQIGPLRDTINALIRFGMPLIPQAKHAEFNDLLNHVLRLSDNIDLGRDIVAGIMDAQLGVVSNRLNDVMRTLTVVSTLLMLCSLIAGVYGMNFERMPELKWTYGYPLALISMGITVIVGLWVFRARKFI